MKKANAAIYIPNMDADNFEKICNEKGLQFVYVEVPSHGRLGDLDEINEKHDKLSRDFCHGYFKSTWDFVCATRKLFYDAPTIIPAEEGET